MFTFAIGCANGYYMFRMLEKNPKLVIGIDPNLKVRRQGQVTSTVTCFTHAGLATIQSFEAFFRR